MNNSIIDVLKKNQDKAENTVEAQQLDENTLRQLQGGRISSGWICTISGECNGGSSCNPFPIFTR